MSFKQLYTILFFIGIFFFPFNTYEGIPALGEYSSEAGALFLMAGFGVLLFSGSIKIPLKNPYLQVFILFLLWCIIATILNIDTVYSNYFKQTGGINRFIRQYFSIILSSGIFFALYWNVIREMEIREILIKIRRVFLYTLIVAFIYGFLETLVVVFNFYPAYNILKLFNYFPFIDVHIHYQRISSVAYEPPFLAIFLITIAGWMFSYIITEKKVTRFVPILMVLFLTYFSGSRTALIIITLQLFIFMVILFNNPKYKRYIIYFFSFSAIAVVLLLAINAEKVIKSVETKLESLNFSDNLTESISNKSRFGIQYASLQVYKKNPIIGVGFGQQSYHSRYEYPMWATKDNYEFRIFYKNQKEKSFPPGFNMYTRLMAETGTIGIVLFLTFITLLIFKSWKLLRTLKDEEKILAITLFITFIGLAINWMQTDTFRMYGFWLCLAILIKLSGATNKNNEHNNSTDTAL
ncbi:hypothetical protein GCM10007424_16930 [Flavobacterium suaedae]|uniref:O-antigen ligase-related domain-containing protein n=1 Tax=Flavobacterium suaedae TaxID=1767027 RepID=A0ABQ1JXW6_9FLAO|nr:O-antigen ligase family protein [Flavobacterium suaedae]GGB77483.1 hypothetical protein GCM10007424_16930 [Flavobacterium suaedae]